MTLVSTLFIDRSGPYWNRPSIDAWDEERDALKYLERTPPYDCVPVIAHPPCERWGKFALKNGRVAQDGGCFETALRAVRIYSGVLEHPEGSMAWRLFNLPVPPPRGWSEPDKHGGRSCLVYQGHYGHRAPKPTWLYAVLKSYPQLIWGPTKPRDLSHLDEKARKRAIKTGICQRLSKRQRRVTPVPFAQLLLRMVTGLDWATEWTTEQTDRVGKEK